MIQDAMSILTRGLATQALVAENAARSIVTAADAGIKPEPKTENNANGPAATNGVDGKRTPLVAGMESQTSDDPLLEGVIAISMASKSYEAIAKTITSVAKTEKKVLDALL
jgi:hypothetical protein